MVLHLKLLGEPQVTVEGTPLRGFISSKAQALLFYLAVSAQPQSRDTLATLFWADMGESMARKNLTKALSNLRKLIGTHLVIDNHTAAMNMTDDVWVDVLELYRAAADENTPPDIDALTSTLDLYNGDFLSGFLVKNAPLFDEWAWAERERCHQVVVSILKTVSDSLMTLEDFESAIRYLQRLLTVDPLNEPAHLRLMQSFVSSNQRSAALAQYDVCRQILADELGVEPMAQIVDYYERLKATTVAPPHNLPSLRGFVGRKAELAELISLISDPDCRLLTIVGTGGIGKTRLALQAAFHYCQPDSVQALNVDFTNGIYWVPLSSHLSIEGMISAIADSVGLTFQGQQASAEQLVNYLRQKRMLLLLDNLEHLLSNRDYQSRHATASGRAMQPGSDGAKFISDLLLRAPELKLMITSRVRLNMNAEHVLHLMSMELPGGRYFGQDGHLALKRLAETDKDGMQNLLTYVLDHGSIQLFLQGARRVRSDFDVTVENVADVVRICQQVQGMPLAILLASSWVTVLTPAEIGAEITHNLDILETQESDVPLRQRSMRATFEYMWRLLSDSEQSLFRKLSLLQGEFTREAAQQVTGASLRDLMNMVDKALLSPNASGSFTIHPLLLQFGIEKLEQLPDVAHRARDQHCQYFAESMVKRGQELKNQRQRNAMLAIERDGVNLHLAWLWAIKEGQLDRLMQMADTLCQFYEWRGRYSEGAEKVALALSGVENETSRGQQSTAGSEADPSAYLLHANLLIWQGVFEYKLGSLVQARALLLKSLFVLQSVRSQLMDVKGMRAFALLHLGTAVRESDRESARQYYHESLALYREVNNDWGTANVLAALGWLIQHWGGYDDSRELYQESLAIRRTLGDHRGMADSLRWLAGVILYQGDPTAADRLVCESVAIHRDMGDIAGIAGSLSKQGEVLMSLGAFERAHNSFNEAKALYNELGLHGQGAFVDAMLCLNDIHLGNHHAALGQIASTLDHFRRVQSRRGTAYALLIQGWALSTDGDPLQAKQSLEEAIDHYMSLGQKDELGQSHALLGYAHYRLGNIDAAQRSLNDAEDIALEIQASMPHLLSTVFRIRLAFDKKDDEEISRLTSLIVKHPLVAQSRWSKAIMGVSDSKSP